MYTAIRFIPVEINVIQRARRGGFFAIARKEHLRLSGRVISLSPIRIQERTTFHVPVVGYREVSRVSRQYPKTTLIVDD